MRLWDILKKSTEEEKKKNAYYIKSLEKKATKTNNKQSGLSVIKSLIKKIGL